MSGKSFIAAMALLVLVVSGCKEPFDPPAVEAPGPYLVVEGVLNAGNGLTTIRISRTSPLDNTTQVVGETGANVRVEGRDNFTAQLNMTSSGIYSVSGLNLVIGNEYRLRIITNNGKEYLSDYVVARETPPIDSIGFDRNNNGAQMYVNTRDNSNTTRYYKWEYDETWEIRTFYFSRLKYLGNAKVGVRTVAEDVSTCWKYGASSSLLIGSTARLTNDVVNKAPLQFFFNGDERLAVRYSVLVRQYALDKGAYEFYELMKRNTESLGTVFDPQPTEITGNFTCITDPREPVIGYISASTIAEKRIFVRSSDLGNWPYSQYCPTTLVLNNPDTIRAYFDGNFTQPYDAVVVNYTDTTHFMASSAGCVDCTERGGSLAKPSYW